MKFIFTFLFISVFNFVSVSAFAIPEELKSDGAPTSEIIPNAYESTAGTGTFLGPLANAPRTYQFLIQASQITDLAGKILSGLSLRIPASATANWPLADLTYSNYDIYLSGSVEPSARSLTFASNIVGPRTQVRSGPLNILTNSYTFGSTPNEFGTEITFNTPWYYSGGNLLIEIRHQGFTGTSRSVDALTTSTSGYGTSYSACWTGSYTGTSGTQGNFSIVKLSTIDVRILQLTSLIEGFYDSGSNSMISDTARVYLRNNNFPYDIVDSSIAVLNSNGNGIYNFPNALNGANYFIVVDHRNSIDTWSSTGNSFTGNSLSYDFTTLASQAYGNNQSLKGTRYTLFSGDVNKDDIIDSGDLSQVENDAGVSLSGYVSSDVTGDDFVDATDISILENNAALGVVVVSP
ncbi:MAG TPA: hypothetical protein PKD83_08130 [Ignavibacteria bacterium]|nr:hypothetical protein [Ignavibacteria bacterium]